MLKTQYLLNTFLGTFFCVHEVVQYLQEYLLFVLAEISQDIQRIFVKQLYGQKLDKLKADIQDLIEKIFQAFSPKPKQNYVPRGKEKHSEAIVERFTKMFQ